MAEGWWWFGLKLNNIPRTIKLCFKFCLKHNSVKIKGVKAKRLFVNYKYRCLGTIYSRYKTIQEMVCVDKIQNMEGTVIAQYSDNMTFLCEMCVEYS